MKQPPCSSRMNINLRFSPALIVSGKAFTTAALTVIKFGQQMEPGWSKASTYYNSNKPHNIGTKRLNISSHVD